MMSPVRSLLKHLKQYRAVVVPYRLLMALGEFGLTLRWIRGIGAACGFVGEYCAYRRRDDNPHFTVQSRFINPCLLDRTESTPLEPTYFFQDSWAAGKLFLNRPEHHYDIGSSAKTIGIISQFVPTTMIDIRPIDLELPGLSFMKGSVLELPFDDGTLESISSLCVVEHIGLGRYGDPVDPWGSEKAIAELVRVLRAGGNLYVSVPVDDECRVYFNAHRAFTRAYLLQLFDGLELLEERYHYDRAMYPEYDPSKGFGTGMYHFRKRKEGGA